MRVLKALAGFGVGLFVLPFVIIAGVLVPFGLAWACARGNVWPHQKALK